VSRRMKGRAMKHTQAVSRPPATASDRIDTISESKLETKESAISRKAGGQ